MHATPPTALIRLLMLALSVFAVAGCDQMDPLKRPYMWHETEVNAHNIAAMAANADSDSVDRLWSGKTVPLPSDTPGATSGSSTSPAGGAAPGGT
jgi:uncharacterized lipoprotein